MRATLEFDLPDDQYDFRAAVDGPDWRAVVEDLVTHLRSQIKYGQLDDATAQAYEAVRAHVWDEIQCRGLLLD